MKSRHDKLFFLSLIPTGFILMGLLAIFVMALASNSYIAIAEYGFKLVTTSKWDPEHEAYGLMAPIAGTIVTSLLAVGVSIAFSIPLVITINEITRGVLRNIFSSFIELMSGLPTIVYAIWGLNAVAPLVKDWLMTPLHDVLGFIPLFGCKPVTGLGVLTAGLVIGVSLIPFTTALISEAYRMIPVIYREACLGLGATKYETVKVMLSIVKPAIIASILLSFARATGETTIAALLIGNSMNFSICLFAPGYTVSALIASQYGSAAYYTYAEPVLYFSALLTLSITLVLSFSGSELINKWRAKVHV